MLEKFGDVAISLMVNGVAAADTEPVAINKAKTASDINMISLGGARSYLANDAITIAASSSAAINLTVVEASFSIRAIADL
jgi:hypothetical protein